MTRLDRRNLLKTGAAAGVLAASGLPLGAAARRGGVLRLGVGGAHATDSWDSRTHRGQFMIMAGHGAVFDTLTQVAASGELIGELAESWEASADAKVWTFRLRQGVEFHNGKLFDAQDVIASLRLHLEPHSPARGIVSAISEMEALGSHEVRFHLAAPNADFPFLLADYHLCIYPADNMATAMSQGIGTGLYKVIGFTPGKRAMLGRVRGHYKDGKEGWFDAVELIAMNEPSDRVNALLTGQVDAINDLDLAQKADVLKKPTLRVSDVVGNQHIGFSMRADRAPFYDVNLRKALKHAVDRQAIVDETLLGHGQIGADHPIGPLNQYLAGSPVPNDYDPDQSRFYLKKAGLRALDVQIDAGTTAHSAMARLTDVVARDAQAAGINVLSGQGADLTVQASVWSGRVTEDWMFTMMAAEGGAWNDSQWQNPQFQNLLLSARAELATDKRRALYQDMQELMANEGGALIPAFANFADAHHVRLKHGPSVGNLFAQDSGRMIERWWFA